MTDCEPTNRARRPLPRMISDPCAMRALGREKYLKAHENFERNSYDEKRRRNAPMMPTDRWDEGLVYASRAGLIAPQSVRPLACQARVYLERFRQLSITHRGRAGPFRDANQLAEIWLAISFVKQMARRKGVFAGTARNADVRDALKLLFDLSESIDAVKKRRQRFRCWLMKVKAARRQR